LTAEKGNVPPMYASDKNAIPKHDIICMLSGVGGNIWTDER